MSNHVSNVSVKKKKTALLLCIFGGFLGLHLFYVGEYKRAVLFMLTLGLAGVGWIIDIIKIASNSFLDNSGAPLAD